MMHLCVEVANSPCGFGFKLYPLLRHSSHARRLGLTPAPCPGLIVGVTNDERIACDSICSAVPIVIDNERFDIDLFIIALEDYEMVLGCQWLRTLGPIL
jgi:hypothetical protein